MKKRTNHLASIGLAIGAVFGLSGLFFTEPVTQTCLFVISGVGLSAGLALLSVKFLRENDDCLAAGFMLFSIGEAILTCNTPAEESTADASFACGMLFYVVAFILISLSKRFPLWLRLTGLAAAIPFSIAAARFLLGYGIDSSDTFPGMGYGLLTLCIVGWIITLLREK